MAYVQPRYDVDEDEILPEERKNPAGTRLTVYACHKCNGYLTEEELSFIRNAHAPCLHYKCFTKKAE